MSDLDVGAAALGWWRAHLGEDGPGRATRARLRRVSAPVEAVQIAAVHDLNRRLGGALTGRGDKLALIAVALANLRENPKDKAAERMAGRVAPLRFQRLVRIEAPGDLIVPLRRALAQIDGAANVVALAHDLFYWSDTVRTRWCFSYYGATSAAPEQPEETKA
ncbi:type I-E CRISPR-associated protein Cse2/CasB [Defluviimonas sp. SAOS-178_SWC]|uniref:type I-E CRISPR-associated protein Cse2/CasB n=1 Tax=Defluviimonas sp. SAOS-178_SWC TaxID=3121287 RepID=UPI0032221C47